jgi:hypothetical protein
MAKSKIVFRKTPPATDVPGDNGVGTGLKQIRAPRASKRTPTNAQGAPRDAAGVLPFRDINRYDYVKAVLESPGEDNYFARLSPEQQQKIVKSQNSIKHGTKIEGPIWCFGPTKCPFHALCPLADFNDAGEPVAAPIQDYPLGRPCILEDTFVRNQVVSYMEDLGVQHNSSVEMPIVKELALIDLLKQRALNILSVGDKNGQGRDFMQEFKNPIGLGPNGKVLEVTTALLHPLYELIDKLEARRQRWLSKLVATRKDRIDAQAKLGQKEERQQMNDTILDLKEYLRSLEAGTIDMGVTRVIPIDD